MAPGAVAEVVCLGCAGMSGLDVRMSGQLGIPVVDGVSCAVGLVESLVRRGLTTSKSGIYAAPLPKLRSLPTAPAGPARARGAGADSQ